MTNIYKKMGLILGVVFITLILTNVPSQAATETIQYGYDDALQLTNVTYDNDTEVDYVYDNMGNRMFKTTTFSGVPANNPPNAASNPDPPDGVIDVSSTPALSWTGGGDPDGNPVIYYLHLGESASPPLVMSGMTTSFISGQLKSYTTYYWKVVSRDNRNAETESPLWSFTTGNNPPIPSFSADQTIGMVPAIIKFRDTSIEPEDEILSWAWDFNNDSIIDSTEQNPLLTYNLAGIYSVSLTVTDIHGASATETKIDYIAVYNDADGDGIHDGIDNCVSVFNPYQKNVDGDLMGDACDSDADGDGVDNGADVCPAFNDPAQADSDGDGYGDACTQYHCVTDSAELQAVLTLAEGNNMNDIIRLAQGSYGVSGNNSTRFQYYSDESRSLIMQGGYTTGCSNRVINPENTILDGEGTSWVLSITASDASIFTEIRAEGVTIKNGVRGVQLSSPDGMVVLTGNIIRDNVSENSGDYAGAYVTSTSGDIVIANNIITNNIADNYGGGIYVRTTGEFSSIQIINNTISNNEALINWGFGGGIKLQLDNTISIADIYNNIIWDNSATTGADIYLYNNAGGTINAFNNILNPEGVYGTFSNEGDNYNINPKFVDSENGDYHLASGSPGIDAGNITAPFLPSEDHEGDSRVMGINPDIGADEYYITGTIYSISGRITVNTAGMAGAHISLTGDLTATKITDDNGYYSFTWLSDGNYTVTPIDSLFSFTPAEYAVTVSGSDITDQNFSADFKDTDGDTVYDHLDNCPDDANTNQTDSDSDGYGDVCDLPGSISGTVIDEISGLGIEGVEVKVGVNSTFTGANGAYTITGLPNGNLHVAEASKSGYFSEYYDDTDNFSYAKKITVYPEQDTPGIDFALTPDTDSDGLADVVDNCPNDYNPYQSDMDNNGTGDACDPDVDGDGVSNETDVCPYLSDPDQTDSDGDGRGDVCTVTHCVSTSSELQAALDIAQSNIKDDIIKIVQGTYRVSDNNNLTFSYDLTSYTNSLNIQGGFTAGCASRVSDPSNTVLDGEGVSEVLNLHASHSFFYAETIVDGITVQNGISGLRASLREGSIALTNNIIKNNSRQTGAGVGASTSNGEIVLANNIIINNTATDSKGGAYVSVSDAGVIKLMHNTITGNRATSLSGDAGGLYVSMHSDLVTAEIYNNIIWGNSASSGGDIYINNTDGGFIEIFHNNFDIAKVYGTFTNEGNNININPQFEDALNGDYHLASGSPCIDSGDNVAPALPLEDYEGDSRVLGIAPDMGADEYFMSGQVYSISGQITLNSSGMSGIKVNLSGDAIATKITDDNGNYNLTWIGDGSYAVRPEDVFYDFTPVEYTVIVSGTDISGQDFTAVPIDTDGDGVYDFEDNCPNHPNSDQADSDGDGYGNVCDLPGTISGTVIDEVSGSGIAGVMVLANGPRYVGVYADANGNYTISGLDSGDYTVYTYNTSGYLDEYYDDVTNSSYSTPVTVYPQQDTSGINLILKYDSDDDNVADATDNCPDEYNPNQEDNDGDGYGNVCDNCPAIANSDQLDSDGNGAGDVCTVNHCVKNAAEFQQALNDAETNSLYDVVQLENGTYSIADNGGNAFTHNTDELYGLRIEGGYFNNCSERALDPVNTILDGNSSVTAVLDLRNYITTNMTSAFNLAGNIKIDGITIQNGFKRGIAIYFYENGEIIISNNIVQYNGSGGGAYKNGILILSETYYNSADIILENNIISNNQASGIEIDTSKNILLVNNIISGNINTSYVGAKLTSQYGDIALINNTVTDNTATSYEAGVFLYPAYTLYLYNNIIVGNLAPTTNGNEEISALGYDAAYVYNNNYDPARATFYAGDPIEANNINADPLFVDGANGDYHLSAGSPCIDTGDISAPSLPPADYEGDVRVLGIKPDIGADEFYTAGPTYLISGQITSAGSPLAGVPVNLSGDAVKTKVTDDNGSYSFTWLADGSYTVTPALPPFTFNPADRSLIVNGSDLTGQNFTATAPDGDGDGVYDFEDNCPNHPNLSQSDADGDGYGDVCDLPGSISGAVTDEVSGLGIEGVRVRASGPSSKDDYTDANGNYVITGLDNGDYRVYTYNTSGYLDENYDDVYSSYYATLVTVDPEQDINGIGFVLSHDIDDDGIADAVDNCPNISNSNQADMDVDNIGDVCDGDIDGDGYNNDVDVCPILNNPFQLDTDGDGYGDACTVNHCVTTSAELQAALDIADYNSMADVIQLVQGTFGVSGNNGSQFYYYSSQYYSLVIRGGYTAGCAARVANPTNTIIDGEGVSRAINLGQSSSSVYPRWILVEGVTVQNGNQGMYLSSNKGDITVQDSVIKDNNYNSTGSGLYVSVTSGTASVLNNEIRDNNTTSSASGMYVYTSEGDVVVSGNIITGNSANSYSGGMYVYASNGYAVVTGNKILDNSSMNSYAGGVYANTSSGEIVLTSNIIAGNAANSYAGGIYAYVTGAGGRVRLINNTITENEVMQTSGYGGGVYVRMSNALAVTDIYNNIIWGNIAQASGGDIYLYNSTGTTNVFSNDFDPNEVYGTFTSKGSNINIDPQFVDAINGDYHLSSGSACIETGDNAAPSLPAYDFDGEQRTIDGDGDAIAITDIGADEYTDICLNLPVRIDDVSPVYFATFQEAYDAAMGGDTIQSHDTTFDEDIFIDINKTITLQGGFSCDYTAISGITTIIGNMTITDGTLIINDGSLVIE